MKSIGLISSLKSREFVTNSQFRSPKIKAGGVESFSGAILGYTIGAGVTFRNYSRVYHWRRNHLQELFFGILVALEPLLGVILRYAFGTGTTFRSYSWYTFGTGTTFRNYSRIYHWHQNYFQELFLGTPLVQVVGFNNQSDCCGCEAYSILYSPVTNFLCPVTVTDTLKLVINSLNLVIDKLNMVINAINLVVDSLSSVTDTPPVLFSVGDIQGHVDGDSTFQSRCRVGRELLSCR